MFFFIIFLILVILLLKLILFQLGCQCNIFCLSFQSNIYVIIVNKNY